MFRTMHLSNLQTHAYKTFWPSKFDTYGLIVAVQCLKALKSRDDLVVLSTVSLVYVKHHFLSQRITKKDTRICTPNGEQVHNQNILSTPSRTLPQGAVM